MKKISTLLVASLASAYLMSGVVIFAGEPEGPGGFIFSAFTARVEVEHEDNNSSIEVESEGNFTLDPLGDGIDPVNEEVIVKIGDFVFTVPAGSFHLRTKKHRDIFSFEGTVNGASFEMEIRQIYRNNYSNYGFSFEIENGFLGSLTAPTTLFLSVGDDFGEVAIPEFDD